MNIQNYSVCLSGRGLNSGTLNGLYDFVGVSGNGVFNLVYPTGSQINSGQLIASKNPAIAIRSGHALSDVVTGNMSGFDLFRVGATNNFQDFTILIDYDLDFCSVSGNHSLILASSNIQGSGTSGFAFGINQTNRLFFEYYDSGQQTLQAHTLNSELDNKSTVLLSMLGGKLIDLAYYDYETDSLVNKNFNLSNYNSSNQFYLGGMFSYSGTLHTGLIGSLNNAAIFSGFMSLQNRTDCIECLFSTGVLNPTGSNTFNIYGVTGFNFVSSGVTGVTGYSYLPVQIPHPTGGSTTVMQENALTGVVSQSRIVTPSTGIQGTGTAFTGAFQTQYDYSLKMQYSNKTISLFYPLQSGDIIEVESYSRPQNNLNIPSDGYYLNKGAYSGTVLFQNGVLNVEGLDFNITNNYFVGADIQGYDPTDVFQYNLTNDLIFVTPFSGLWSGSKILVNSGSSGTGIVYFPPAPQYIESGTNILITGISGIPVTGFDLFLNGQKLAQNFEYEIGFSGSTPVVNLYGTRLPSFGSTVTYSGAGSGYAVSGWPNYPLSGITGIYASVLVFVQKPLNVQTFNYINYFTGISLTGVSITGFSEQVWVNGIKQVGLYAHTYQCSPTSGLYDYGLNSYKFYNNDINFFNVE